jgi:hypothetical protein
MGSLTGSQSLNGAANHELDVLVCIYTCKKHADLLLRFYASEFGEYLRSLPNTLVLEVYADPEVSESMHDNDRLILKTREDYENLSVKTWLMIEYCISNFRFKDLVKVDVTNILPRSNLASESSHAEITPKQLVDFVEGRVSFGDYEGIKLLSNAGRQGAENWARKKGGEIDYQRIFGERNMPGYYTGKCYALSYRFAQYIAQHGEDMAQEHARYLMGSEDVMIGRLNESFIKDQVK